MSSRSEYDSYKTSSILGKLPTVFIGGGMNYNYFLHAGKVFELTEVGIKFRIDDKKDDYLYIGHEQITRYLDNLILQAISLGFINDNKHQPLKNLLSKETQEQLETTELRKIVLTEPHPESKKMSL